MGVIRDRAMELRGIYGIEGFATDRQLDALMTHLGISSFTLSALPGDVRELYYHPAALFRAGQGVDWDRWNKAHVIGHCSNHVGDQGAMAADFVVLQERQANLFAGLLVVGDPIDIDLGDFEQTLAYVSEQGRLPRLRVRQWLETVGVGAWRRTWRVA